MNIEVMTYMTDSGAVTITEETVRQEVADIELMANELAARRDRFAKLAGYLRAIGREAWIPAGAEKVTTSAPARGPEIAASGTWGSEMLRELEAFPDGIALVDLLEVMKSGPLAARANQNRNGLYNASSKLELTGQIVKHNGRVFLSHHYEGFKQRVERGEVEDVKWARPGLKAGVKTATDTLTEYISSQPQGVEAGDVVEAMMKEHGMASGTVYNNLSKIVAKNRVRREGKIYLPLNSEAPAGEPESASEVTDDWVS